MATKGPLGTPEDAAGQPIGRPGKAEASPLRAHRLEDVAVDRSRASRLPPDVKAGIESLSGLSLHDVRVQYGSSKPASVDALAFTSGNDIHIAPGAEHHLAHEAWHVVQQRRGRVRATGQTESGHALNDEAALEHEADVMAERATAPGAEVGDPPQKGGA
jgi:hypothetical protein